MSWRGLETTPFLYIVWHGNKWFDTPLLKWTRFVILFRICDANESLLFILSKRRQGLIWSRMESILHRFNFIRIKNISLTNLKFLDFGGCVRRWWMSSLSNGTHGRYTRTWLVGRLHVRWVEIPNRPWKSRLWQCSVDFLYPRSSRYHSDPELLMERFHSKKQITGKLFDAIYYYYQVVQQSSFIFEFK